jgi:hypothetical protein
MPSAESRQSGLLPVVAPERYEEQLAEKVGEVTAKFARFGMPDPEVNPRYPKYRKNIPSFSLGPTLTLRNGLLALAGLQISTSELQEPGRVPCVA